MDYELWKQPHPNYGKRWASREEYLLSREWLEIRADSMSTTEGYCKFCLIAGVLRKAEQVHHTNYWAAWGTESPDLDCVPLCKEHHAACHAREDATDPILFGKEFRYDGSFFDYDGSTAEHDRLCHAYGWREQTLLERAGYKP